MTGYNKLAVCASIAGFLVAPVAADVPCTCPHGDKANDNCPVADPEKCTKCNMADGYYLDGEKCKRCTGNKYLDTDSEKCVECPDPHMVLDVKHLKCSHQVCTCENGVPLKDQECTLKVNGQPRKEYCKSCNTATGYKIKSSADPTCVKCADGEYLDQVDKETCRTCSGGKKEKPNLLQTKCNKVCTCAHGREYTHEKCTAAVGVDANSEKQEYCEECTVGYSLSSDGTTCEEQEKCHCDNGTPVAGALCWENGGGVHMCETCHSGYGFGGWPNAAGKCVAQGSPSCTCTDGIGAKGEFCTKMGGGEVCVRCTAPGKVLTWDAKCKDKTEIKCTCRGGSVVDDVSCLMRGGGEACKACGGGFGDKNQMPFENGSCMNNEERTASYAPEELRIVYGVNNLDYTVLSADTIIRAKVELAAKQALVALIGAEMTTADIEVTLSAGSTIVNAKLTMPTNAAGRNLAHKVRQPAFNSHIAQLLGQINGLKLTDNKTPQVGTVQIQMTPKKLPNGAVTRPVQRPAAVQPQVPAVQPLPQVPVVVNPQVPIVQPPIESSPVPGSNPAVGMLYSVEPAQTTRTTNFPLISSVATAFFAGGLFVARALPAARGWTSREQGLVELEQASPLTH